MADIFKPATAIVNEILLEELTDDPCLSLPKPINLAKVANHLRQRHRPSEPVDLEFELQTNQQLDVLSVAEPKHGTSMARSSCADRLLNSY